VWALWGPGHLGLLLGWVGLIGRVMPGTLLTADGSIVLSDASVSLAATMPNGDELLGKE